MTTSFSCLSHPCRSRPVLVFLADGVQGAAVVRAALRHGLSVRALVRRPSLSRWSGVAGVETVAGDLDDAASLRDACRGAGAAVLHFPSGTPEAMRRRARDAASAARTEGIGAVILRLSSASRPAPCTEPSFLANQAAEEEVRRSGLPVAVVRPTFYLDNLLRPATRAEIVETGIFSLPVTEDRKVAWTSVDDCAEAALRLLARGPSGGDHRIAGPRAVSGPDLAGLLTQCLARPVRYRAEPVAEFEQAVEAARGGGMGARIGSKFRYFADHAEEMREILAEPFRPQAELAGFEPRDPADWLMRHRTAFLAPLARP